jgi:hypothetical protein
VIRAVFALVTVGLIVVAIAAHAFGAGDIADWSGTGAYFALVLALIASAFEALFARWRSRSTR